MGLLTSALARAGLGVVSRIAVILRQLFHEITATLFLALGLLAIPPAIREWRGDSLLRAVLVTIFIAIMVYYGVTSFWKARKTGNVKEGRKS